MIEIFFVPIVLVVMLVMIHAWFGMGILKRGVIFTDLAIAQFAALGSAVSLAYFHEEYFYLLTLSFSLFSALLIAISAKRDINHEAFIGLLYVLGASGIMIVLSHSAEGMEHFKSLLASDILFTSFDDMIQSALIYLGIALFIWIIYPNLSGFTKELIFFALLAVTVTSSVQLVGVLVVFTFLIAPAFLVNTFTFEKPMFTSYLYGWFFSIVSIIISYYYDLPTGYTIVFIGAFLSLFVVLFSKKRQVEL